MRSEQQVRRFPKRDNACPLLEWRAGPARVPKASSLAQGWWVEPQHGETLASWPPPFLGQTATAPASTPADFKPARLPAGSESGPGLLGGAAP